jgi:hypothetical protein
MPAEEETESEGEIPDLLEEKPEGLEDVDEEEGEDDDDEEEKDDTN